uniref:Uncharacterized protein n=1 Tax=Rhizophora mucronata TaxID=61149 RepID=A0A2P2Q9Z7_RHIMU
MVCVYRTFSFAVSPLVGTGFLCPTRLEMVQSEVISGLSLVVYNLER